MPYDSRAVANYFLDVAEASGRTLDPMQIQKLVYFAHGWNLAIAGDALIDDTIEAWQYGPVIPTLYHEFKHFGKGPITRKASMLRVVDHDKWVFIEPAIDATENTKGTRHILDLIWDVYGGLTGIQLSNLTHGPDTPWKITWQQAQGRKNVDIPDGLIRQYFMAQLEIAVPTPADAVQ
jgi:uncharacterized phage-associated protein